MTGIVRRLGRRMLGASGPPCHRQFPSPTIRAEQEIRERIVFLQSDSRAVDLSQWYECAGLVIVDGGHAEDVCANDTTLALKLVRRGGVVVWDDYTPYWPGVKSTLEALAGRLSLTWYPSYPRLGLVVHISGK